ncbi:MAG TPA: methyl-accepting chemotaxis protein, partial [Solirubrobacterales bacterium]|nr:methyl-accepting chemotaxis protein [Solirubrobacterales bacterium]
MGRSTLLARLLASFGALALIAGLVGSVGMWAFSRVNAAFQVAVHQSLPAVTHLVEADRDMQQAVLAERSLMFMKLAAPSAREQIKSHRDHLVKVVERWKRYTAIPASDEERGRWSAFEAARSEWAAASRDVLEVLANDSPGARRDAVDLSLGEAAAKFDKARALLNELIERRLGLVRAHANREGDAAARLAWWILASVVGAFTLAGVLAFRFAHWVARPLRQAVTLLKDIAEGAGDLTKRLTVGSSDEVGELARWFNLFMDRLHEIIGQVRATAVHVASASQQLSEATTHLSTGAQQHASSLEETAASLEEITGTVRQTADNAHQANQLARSS